MDELERRVFLKVAGMGLFAFTVGGASVMMTPGEARAKGVPFRLLKANEAETIEALGETLIPGAREAGIAHFIDQQVSVPPGEALLEARIVNVKPPFINFYRAAIAAVDKASEARSGRRFAALSAEGAARPRRPDAPEQDRRLAGARPGPRLLRAAQRRRRRGVGHHGGLRRPRRARTSRTSLPRSSGELPRWPMT